MTTRVRFAPSPTGNLHIGGARTAIFNYLFAKATGGINILRIEDTDLERSTKESEDIVIENLKWLGIDFQEGPDNPGKLGPYRQSERFDLYKKYALKLVDEGKAFHCFCTNEELEAKKEIAMKENRAPHYDGTCKKLSKNEIQERLDKGEPAVIRFSAPKKAYSFKDLVRGDVEFPVDMVGDFVILRSNGLPVYNYCCVIDDWLMQITHVLRAEDHLPNTVRQLMIYEGLGQNHPVFGHVSLLVGEDRQKLSKRHGATSVQMYIDDSYMQEAMNNYLCQLGWSHPDEKDIFTMDELSKIFDLTRFTKAPSLYDMEKLNWVNGQHLRELSVDQLWNRAKPFISSNEFMSQNDVWQKEFLDLFKIKIDRFSEYNKHLDDLFRASNIENDGMNEIFSWESTLSMKGYLNLELDKLIAQNKIFAELSDFEFWINHLKSEMKIKGKNLFKGLRGVITGMDEGPDVKRLAMLTPLEIIKKRIG